MTYIAARKTSPQTVAIMQTGKCTHHAGFTFIGVLLIIMLVGFTLAEAGNVWSQARKRDREQELLKVGDKFRSAIRDYYNATPGPVKHYPKTLNDLIRDDRFPKPQRYIRKIYIDPVTQREGWGRYDAFDGGIMGVFSFSNEKPYKKKNFPEIYKEFEKKTSYADWVFAYVREKEAIDVQ